MSGDLKDPRWMWVKFGLFLVLGSLSVAIAILLYPSLRLAALMALAIWAFARAYYFLFYVIEHYIDDEFRFAGLGSVVAYLLRTRRRGDGGGGQG